MQNRPFLCVGVFEDMVFDKEQNQTLLHPTNTTDNKWILPVMLGIIGLAVVSFVLAMIYLYTHKPWNENFIVGIQTSESKQILVIMRTLLLVRRQVQQYRMILV